MRHVGAGPRLVPLLVATALVLPACGSTAQPGTAAYVGDDTVGVRDLQNQVDDVLAYRSDAQPAADGSTARDQVPAITQQVLAQEVRHRLLEQALARTGFQADEQVVTEQLQGADETLLDSEQLSFLTPDTLQPFLRDQLVTIQLGQDAWDGLAVTIDVAPATDRTDAEAKAQRMAQSDAEATAVVQEALAVGGQAQQALELTPGLVDPTLFATPVFSAPQGSGIAFQLGEAWQAARVVVRTDDAERATGADVVTGAQAPAQSAYGLGRSLLPDLAGGAQVRLNPRYGQWDAGQGTVIAESDVPVAVVVDPRG